MAYIFLDECGQFYKNGTEEYFVIAAFIVSDPRRTAKRFKAWCRSKFPKSRRSNEYYALLKNNIIGEGKEMFKDYWGSKFDTKNST